MSGEGPYSDDIAEVFLAGEAVGRLVVAVDHLTRSGMVNFALIGGLAVLCRIERAHRATADVDTVTDKIEKPDLVEILRHANVPASLESHGPLVIDGVKVDVIATGAIQPAVLKSCTQHEALFLLSHRWALESSTSLRIRVDDSDIATVTPVATPGALVAMKLHAIEDRKATRPQKIASDAQDIFHLLDSNDADEKVARALLTAPDPLARLVASAARRVLIDGAIRLSRSLIVHATSGRPISEEDFAFVGRRLLAGMESGQ